MQKRGGAFAAGCACGSYHLQAGHGDGHSRKYHRYPKYVVTLNDSAIPCPTTLFTITSYQKSFHLLNQVLLQIGHIYAIIKAQ